MNENIFVFDVDGIIVDSTDECLIIAWNAYQEFIGEKSFIKSVMDASDEYDNKFRLTRNYVRAMGEYLVLFEAQYSQIQDQNEFENMLSNLKKEDIKRYGDIFLKNRNVFKSKNYNVWISLHRYYEGIKSILSSCNEKGKLYIVTGKDRESSVELLSQLEIEIKLERIFHMDISINKLESLKKIASIEGVEYKKIHFVDDNVTHLREPQKEGFTVALGDWGYALPEHVKRAKKYKMPVISINEVMNFMFFK